MVNGLCTILPRKFRNFTKLVICRSDDFFSILVRKLSLLKDILFIRNTTLKKTKNLMEPTNGLLAIHSENFQNFTKLVICCSEAFFCILGSTMSAFSPSKPLKSKIQNRRKLRFFIARMVISSFTKSSYCSEIYKNG